jgi:hypothetical protein
MDSEPSRVTLRVVEVFDRLGIPYLIGGSLASAVYGVYRATLDVDLVADIQSDQISQLVELLKDEFYIDPEMILDAIQHTASFNLIHLETMFKVDVFILKKRPFDQNQMQRRILHLIGEGPSERAYFSTAEDIILAKLEWFRAGGEVSDRQWSDIIGVIKIQASQIDSMYLQQWAGKLGLKDLLQRALQEGQNINP